MDKNAIKKFAVQARIDLIESVARRAKKYGIEKEHTVDANADSVNGKILSDTEKKQRKALIAKIGAEGYEQVMEEMAYTWFNRFCALRFMEVNEYLPSRVRVFTDADNNFKPQILAEAIHLDLDGLDMGKVYELKESNNEEDLYRYLLITQCNALSKVLPGMFQKIEDYTELCLPDFLLREGSTIDHMIAEIKPEEWKDQIQIIGWLYQYYNTEKKDEVFAALKKNIKITKENLPAATQLFTPDWIVRYMVENSLGRLWVEGHPDSAIRSEWEYYLDEAEQEAEVQAQLDEIRKEYAEIKPEEIRCIDPCAGSGHICAYLFDVLMQIYQDYGYNARESVRSIIENNLYGLDIDERAAQLAYFSVMMKAVQYDARFLRRNDIPQPHVYAIEESNNLNKQDIEYFTNSDPKLERDFSILINELHDAKEYGSILNVTQVDFDALYMRVDEVRNDISIYKESTLKTILPLVQVAETLAQNYHVVVTNPPYMGSSNMDASLAKFVKENYPDSKGDLSTVCMERTLQMCMLNGYMGMINIPVWMFLSSYENLRINMFQSNTLVNMVHPGRGIFGSDFGTTTFVLKKGLMIGYQGSYRRLFDQQGEVKSPDERECAMLEGKGRCIAQQSNFAKIPGSPVAYWVSENFIKTFENKKLGEIAQPRQGMATSDNNRFLRLWYEVENEKMELNAASNEQTLLSNKKWFPYNKGGDFRRWYGNNDYVVNWENDGFEVKALAESLYHSVTRTIKNMQFYFKPSISWSLITSGTTAFRYKPQGHLFDVAGMSCFSNDDLFYLLALCNSKVIYEMLKVISPTINCQCGDVAKLPVIFDESKRCDIDTYVRENISLSKADWDDFETSWDFTCHPLVKSTSSLSAAFIAWQCECFDRFSKLKTNEQELNRIFIDIYGLQDELTPEIEDRDVTVRLADKTRDIRSFISYAVGCMFGRYSLDMDGLTYAGGEWDASKYTTFIPDKDAIIPICDDEYFTDDIVNRFVDFVRVVYGEDTLEENLKFIADALGGSGSARQVIRNYFINDFYNDHCKIYQKRPIYWLFDSGKKNGFKCLIYMHRYQSDTIARIRTDYVHEQQSRYRTAIADLEVRILSAATSERVRLNKQLSKLQAQSEELRAYEEKIHHLADQYISIDLDDGVKVNYAKFQDVLAKIK